MINRIRFFDTPQEIQDFLHNKYTKGYTLTKIKYGFYFFKKSDTPQEVTLYIEKNAPQRAQAVSVTEHSSSHVTISYSAGKKQNFDELSSDLLAIFYNQQLLDFNHFITSASILLAVAQVIFIWTNIFSRSLSGWFLAAFISFFFINYMRARKFKKEVYKPLLLTTDAIDYPGTITFVFLLSRKLREDEITQLNEIGKLEYSNPKNNEHVYKFKSLKKYRDIETLIKSFDNIKFKIYTASVK
ncbi:MAG: hypothetical protein RR422_04690 [Erysipelothrix sp.]